MWTVAKVQGTEVLRHARDFPQLPLCDRDRPSRHLVFFGVW